MSNDLLSASVPAAAQNSAVLAQQQQAAIRPLNGNDVQGSANDKKFDKTLQDYEGVFLSQMVSHMYETVPVDPEFGGGAGEETMRTLLINEYGKQMAQRGGVGLAAAMKKQLLAAQADMAAKQAAVPGATAAPAVTTTAATDEVQQ
jgi:Rod binding domain-containing protein